ncbi:MAG: redoxin family protein [Anaerorhabdus sp.]|uniref:redoxin family protein n=1 Tax=Anaerorhabdus sp. TaxID=1872524 RepID=UPI003A898BB1
MKKGIKLITSVLGLSLLLVACTAAPKTGKMEKNQEKDMMETTEPAMDEKKDDTMMDKEKIDMTNSEMSSVFEYTDFDGNMVSSKDFEGKKVYIKYWASWCPICLGGLGDIDKLSTMDNDFVVLTVVTPGYKGEKTATEFKEWFNGLEYKNIKVLFDQDGKIAKELGVKGFPTSAYISSDGSLVKVSPGHFDNDAIIETFTSIK